MFKKEDIQGGIIVSCQAQPDEPLYSSFIMGKMALAAEQAGAVGIRASTVEDIEEIRKNTNLPIIGIVKKNYKESKVFITPTIRELILLAESGVEIIALDATKNKRPFDEKLEDIVNYSRVLYPNILLMADCSNLDDVYKAQELEFDFIGTTLFGLSKKTDEGIIFENNAKILKKIINEINIPIIVEGHINTPELAEFVQDLKPFSMVIGSAITRPKWIAERFIKKIKGE